MPVDVEVLYYKPQQEIASRLCDAIERSVSLSLISGFVTPSGIEQIAEPLVAQPAKLKSLVIGAGTYRAFEAMDGLLEAGIAADRLLVHLGMTRETGGRKNPFARYHPMLHSKVYLLDMGRGRASALVGSHNLTGFAMQGLNGEASIFLEGDSDDAAFEALRRHVKICEAQAAPYNAAMKAAYAWWTAEFLDGLRVEVNTAPRESEARNTIIVMASADAGSMPIKREVIYFEMPQELAIESLRAEVHLFVFDTLPASPYDALNRLKTAHASLRCSTLGIDRDRGNLEVRADWYIDDRKRATLRTTPTPFRPNTQSGMQQVRVQVENAFEPTFEYLFETERLTWMPVLEAEGIMEQSGERKVAKKIGRSPRSEDGPWFQVRSLEPRIKDKTTSKELALLEASPSSGSFIVVSPRRRRRSG